MWTSINNLNQVICLAENWKWACHLNLFSMARVNIRILIRHHIDLNSCLCVWCSINFLVTAHEHNRWVKYKYIVYPKKISIFSINYRINPKYWDTLSIYHTCLKIWIVHSTTSWCVLTIAACMINSVDPDQMPQNVASDLGLHCLQSLSVPILRVIMVVPPIKAF